MSSTSWTRFALAMVLALTPAAVTAQGRTPRADSAAIGGDVGLFIPRDGALNSGAALEGFYEYYLTARNSLRLGLGWTNPGFEGRDDDDTLRHFRVAFDLVHNWEHGEVHPFAGAGLGIYFLQPRDNGENFGDADTKLGGTLFGGAEFFLSPTLAVKGEARYHIISNVNGLNPDGLALSVGLKKYF